MPPPPASLPRLALPPLLATPNAQPYSIADFSACCLLSPTLRHPPHSPPLAASFYDLVEAQAGNNSASFLDLLDLPVMSSFRALLRSNSTNATTPAPPITGTLLLPNNASIAAALVALGGPDFALGELENALLAPFLSDTINYHLIQSVLDAAAITAATAGGPAPYDVRAL